MTANSEILYLYMVCSALKKSYIEATAFPLLKRDSLLRISYDGKISALEDVCALLKDIMHRLDIVFVDDEEK
jgi:hypothetical protein